MFTRHPDRARRFLVSDPGPTLILPVPQPAAVPPGPAGQMGRGAAPPTLLGYMDTLELFAGFSLATLAAKEIDSWSSANSSWPTANYRSEHAQGDHS